MGYTSILTGKTVKAVLNDNAKGQTKKQGRFNAFVEKNRKEPERIGTIPVFAFAHTGAMGVLNRNAVYDNDGKRTTDSSLQNMLYDWRYVWKELQR